MTGQVHLAHQTPLAEAFAFIRADAARHRDEARQDFEDHAASVWASLGMVRPEPMTDDERVRELIRVMAEQSVVVVRKLTAAYAPLIRELQRLGAFDNPYADGGTHL